MKLVKCIVREAMVEQTTDALRGINISGFTVTRACGRGRTGLPKQLYRCVEFEPRYGPQMMIDVVVADHAVDEVVRVVMETAQTGTAGDGRVFVIPVEEAYTIRTHAGGPD